MLAVCVSYRINSIVKSVDSYNIGATDLKFGSFGGGGAVNAMVLM